MLSLRPCIRRLFPYGVFPCSVVTRSDDSGRLGVDVTAQRHNNTTITTSIDFSRSDLVTTPQGNSIWIEYRALNPGLKYQERYFEDSAESFT